MVAETSDSVSNTFKVPKLDDGGQGSVRVHIDEAASQPASCAI